jgi:hypothetical protein
VGKNEESVCAKVGELLVIIFFIGNSFLKI